MNPNQEEVIINGEVVVVPKGATEAQLRAVAKSLKEAKQAPTVDPAPKASAAPSTLSLMVDKAKAGFAEGLGTYGGIYNALGGALVEAPIRAVNLVSEKFTGKPLVNPNVLPDKDFVSAASRRFSDVTRGSETLKQEALGVQGYEGQDKVQKVLAAGAKAVGDPLTVVTAGAGAVTKQVAGGFGKQVLSRAAPVITTALGNFVAGVGAEESRGLAEAAGAGPVIQTLASVAGGGLASGVAANAGTKALTKAAPNIAKKYFDMNPQLMSKLGFKPPTDEVELAKQAMQSTTGRQLNAAQSAYEVRTGRKLSSDLEQSYATQKELGIEKPALVGVESPELSEVVNTAAGTSGALRSELQNRVDIARQAAGTAVENKLGTLESNREAIISQVPKAMEVAPQVKASMDKITADVDRELAKFAKTSGGEDATEIGAKAKELLDKQRKAAEAITKPLYDNALDNAMLRGDRVPVKYLEEQVIPKLDEFMLENVFDKNPLLKNAIAKIRDGVASGRGLDTDELSSLKVAINEQLRGVDPNNPSAKRGLMELKEAVFGARNAEGIRVGGMVDAVGPEFSKEFRTADATYASLVGSRFGTKTIKDINTREFTEGVVGKITTPSEPTRIKEFITAAGEQDGIPLAEAALLSKLKRSGTNEEVSAKDFQAWKDKYRDHLEYLPELKKASETLETFVTKADESIKAHKTNLRAMTMENIRRDLGDEKNVLVKDPLAKGYDNGSTIYRAFDNPDDMIKEISKNPTFARDVFRAYKDKPEFITSIENSIILTAMRSGTPQTTLAKLAKDNPILAPAIAKHQQQQGRVFSLIENLKDISPKGKPIDAMATDAVEAKFGVGVGRMYRMAIERLSSPINKVGRLLGEAKAGKERQADILLKQKLTENPEELPVLIKQLETLQAPKASDLEKSKAFQGVRLKLAEITDLNSPDPDVKEAARRKALKGLTDAGKAYAGYANKEYGGVAQRVIAGQNARGETTEPEQNATNLRNNVEDIFNGKP